MSGVVAGPPGGLDGGAGAAAFAQHPWGREAGAALREPQTHFPSFQQLRQDPNSRQPTLHPTSHGGTGPFSFPSAPHPETTPFRRSPGMPTTQNHLFQKVPRDATPQNHPFQKVSKDVHILKSPLPKGPQRWPSSLGVQETPKHPCSPRSLQDHSPGRLLFTSSRYWSTEVRIL